MDGEVGLEGEGTRGGGRLVRPRPINRGRQAELHMTNAFALRGIGDPSSVLRTAIFSLADQSSAVQARFRSDNKP